MHVKDTYYFSHDANARNDPKILALKSIYGIEGYGRFWVLIEILREQASYKLKIGNKYCYKAISKELDCDEELAIQFIDDCIKEFELFKTDGEYFWSESLLRRMKIKEEKSKKSKRAAEIRWNKNYQCERNASALQAQCSCNASKVKESKVNINKVCVKEKEKNIKKEKEKIAIMPKNKFISSQNSDAMPCEENLMGQSESKGSQEEASVDNKKINKQNKQRECAKTALDAMPCEENLMGQSESKGSQEEASTPTAGTAAGTTVDFDAFWNAYPRKIEKNRAYRNWRTRIQEGCDPLDIVFAAQKYSDFCTKTGVSERFIKYPSTFIGPDKPFLEFLNCREVEENGESNGYSGEDSNKSYKTVDLTKFLWQE